MSDNTGNKKPPDMVIAARDVWSELRRRRQFLASEWARDRRVLFVEQPVSLARLAAGRLDPQQKAAGSAARVLKPPAEVEHNIFVVTPLRPLPDSSPVSSPVNSAAYVQTVAAAVRRIGMQRPALWITFEYAVRLLDSIPHSISIYDITDDWTAATITLAHRRRIATDDRALLERADIVFTVSHSLKELKEPLRPDAILMPNGVRLDLYDTPAPPLPAELEDIDPPIIGYTGTLHDDRLDVELISEVAALGAGRYSLVFVGPCLLSAASTALLKKHDNVTIVPPQPFDRLPAFTAHFDTCTIPHALTPFTHSLDPIKAYEYLAAGKPIVSTPVDGMKPLADFTTFASTAAEFHDAVMSVLSGAEKSTPDARRAEAANHSWTRRAAQIDSVIIEKLKS